MQYLLLHYGYAFLVLGLILEGDATLIAAVILAGENYLDLRWVVTLTMLVSVGANALLYEFGALRRMKGVLCRLMPEPRRHRVSHWLHNSRLGMLALLGFRFMWGFRLIIPMAAGLFHIGRRRFFVANLVGAGVWTAVMVFCGVELQALFSLVHERLVHSQSQLAIAVFLVGIAIGIASIPWQLARRRTRSNRCVLSLREEAPAQPVGARPPASDSGVARGSRVHLR